MDLSLLVLQGKPQGKELPIRVSPFIIGRGPECQLRPNSDQVSRQHCALIIRGETVSIRDLGSTNGTIVDGERLTEPITLRDGDIFQVGPLAFQVVMRRAAAADQPVRPATASPAAAPPDAAAADTATADDVLEWLVSDSKNDLPASGSGVYAGETVFNLDMQNNTTDPNQQPSTTPPAESTPSATTRRKPARFETGKKTPPPPSGAAAHAAEDMLRHYLERRPHK